MGGKGERNGARRIREEHAIGGETIDVRGFYELRSIAGNPVRTQGVDGDEDDVQIVRGDLPTPGKSRLRHLARFVTATTANHRSSHRYRNDQHRECDSSFRSHTHAYSPYGTNLDRYSTAVQWGVSPSSAQHRFTEDEVQIRLFPSNRAGVFAAPAVHNDLARLLDPNQRTIHFFYIGVVLVHLLLAE